MRTHRENDPEYRKTVCENMVPMVEETDDGSKEEFRAWFNGNPHKACIELGPDKFLKKWNKLIQERTRRGWRKNP